MNIWCPTYGSSGAPYRCVLCLDSSLLGLYPVLRIYWLLTYLVNLPRLSVIYRKKWVIIMDLTLQSRGDINHLPLAIHQFQSSVVTIGEGASWPCQNRADSSLVYKAFSSPICHIQGDLRLCWSGEDGSSGMWSWAGAGSCQMVCGQEPLI